ncbi:hypothetical protein BH10PSE19_BH10PSE19_15380 [soil metagenome]
METPTVGAIILVPFPFSDLSQSKLRPAVVLAKVDRNDWILCQITSTPYFDPLSIEITQSAFAQGSLQRVSYARPGKLFTGNHELIVMYAGLLKFEVVQKITDVAVTILQTSLKHYSAI